MARPQRKTVTTRDKKRSLARISSCHAGREVGEKLPPNQICVQLPGNRGHHVPVKDDEKISVLKKRIAEAMGVSEKNWGIYVPNNNRLKIVEDTKQVNQVDRDKLHFYPKAVIR
jgi:hypothetical protein